MRGTRWGRRQNWVIVLLASGASAVAGAQALGPFGALAGVVVMAVVW